MEGNEHQQLLERLADIKQGLAVNTVKTTSIESAVSDIKSELKDIRLSFITHAEYETRHKLIQDDIQALEIKTDKIETRLIILENFKSILIGGLLVINAVYLPILIWLVIKQLNK